MTPREILDANGDFRRSPLLDSLGRLDALFTGEGIPYAVVGGLAVVRHGAPRTTLDVDILIEEADWDRIRRRAPDFLDAGIDHARDRSNGIEIDILHPGDKWEMEMTMPHPADISEPDPDLGGSFIGLVPLLALKCAVYRSKLAEHGIEIAAKDLADITSLFQARHAELRREDFAAYPRPIAEALREIRTNLGV